MFKRQESHPQSSIKFLLQEKGPRCPMPCESFVFGCQVIPKHRLLLDSKEHDCEREEMMTVKLKSVVFKRPASNGVGRSH